MLSRKAAPAVPYPEAARDLATLNTALADFDLETLESCPFGSLGFKCWAFVRANTLRPLMFRGRLDANDVASSLAARRVLLNDALHVLLGFDADAIGEVGVFSFVAAQNYCQRFEREARELAQLYVTLLPWFRDDFQAAEYRGRELAAAAPPLLTIPLEREWNAPLTPLQARLKLKTIRSLPPMSWERPQ